MVGGGIPPPPYPAGRHPFKVVRRILWRACRTRSPGKSSTPCLLVGMLIGVMFLFARGGMWQGLLSPTALTRKLVSEARLLVLQLSVRIDVCCPRRLCFMCRIPVLLFHFLHLHVSPHNTTTCTALTSIVRTRACLPPALNCRHVSTAATRGFPRSGRDGEIRACNSQTRESPKRLISYNRERALLPRILWRREPIRLAGRRWWETGLGEEDGRVGSEKVRGRRGVPEAD